MGEKESGMSEASGVTAELLEELNRKYWQEVIKIASESGQDEREWCRANRVAVNTYEKYRAILKKEVGRQQYNGEAIMGNARSRYVDITRRHEAPVTGETSQLEEGARRPYDGKEKDADDNSIGRKGQDATSSMTKIVIETGNTKIFIYEGKRDPATGILTRAVTDHA